MANKDLVDLVYDLVRKVPVGSVTTYGLIANAVGLKSSARLIGYIMNHAHDAYPSVPAHRVVNRNGLLTGKHHFKKSSMQTLLEAEGHVIVNDQIQDFKNKLWDPMSLLE
jgi:methylated-DNA-protein-cysteine methyltransferase-like protein